MRILSNQIKCKKCGDTPFSAHRHDFKYCKCGAVAVDGGMSYLRTVGDLSSAEDMSIQVTDKTYDECVKMLEWCEETGRNKLGVICGLFRVLRENGYDLSISKATGGKSK